MAPSIDDLPVGERVERYLEMAEHTHALALHVQNARLRDAYLELSSRWRALADSTQRSFDPPDKH
jgi:hypothetical protein